MDHSILEDTLPFILDTRNLEEREDKARALLVKSTTTNLQFLPSVVYAINKAADPLTLSYVQNTMSESAAPLSTPSWSLSESESSRSLFIASESSPLDGLELWEGCGSDG